MWFLELTFSDLRQRGVEFICVSSITSAPDSVQSFLNWAASLGDHVRYLVFRNLKDGEQLFDHNQTRQALEFRALTDSDHGTLEKQTDHRRSLGFTDHTFSGEQIGPILFPLIARASLLNYQHRIYEQIDPIMQ